MAGNDAIQSHYHVLHMMNGLEQCRGGHSYRRSGTNHRQPILKHVGTDWAAKGFRGQCCVASNFSLNGGMIPRTAQRSVDERLEERQPATAAAASDSAVMTFRGRNHVVRLINTSPSGAMVNFAPVPHIGEQVWLQLLERGRLPARVRWVREGRIGVSFEQELG